MYDSGLLEQAVSELANRFDGASTEDGVGFNKIDSFFGKSLVTKDVWTPKQQRAAWRMLSKYSKQLASYGINYDDIPEPVPVVATKDRHMCLTATGDAIMVKFEYNPELVSNIKELPKHARKYDPATHLWTVTPTLEIIDSLVNYATHYEFDVEDGVYALMGEIVEQHQGLLVGSRASESDFKIEGLGGTPYPFQLAGIEYGIAAERCFIADQMGLGKTIEALGIIWAKESFPAIIVCPASVKYNWALEALKWLPGKRVGMVKGKIFYHCLVINEKRIYLDKNRHNLPGPYDIIILNYDILKPRPNVWRCYKEYTNPAKRTFKVGETVNEPVSGWNKDKTELVKQHFKKDGLGDSKNGLIEKLLKINPQALIIDESSYAKSYKAQRTIALTQLSKGIPIRLALSGTPVVNRPSELISQLTILGRLDDMGGFWNFAERYCSAYHGRWGLDMSGAQNLEELNEKMRGICYIRRTKSQVLSELPDKQRSDVLIELDNRSEYNEARDDLVKWLKENAKLEEDFLDSIADEDEDMQRYLTTEYRTTAAARAARALQLTRIEHLKQLAAKGKIKMATQWIEDFLDTGEKLVVFANHINIQKSLIKEFKGAAHILGEDSAAIRQDNIQKFQTDINCKLIVCSLKAGGIGITLTAASDVAFLELGWTPAEHDQAEDRIHRIGQKDGVTAWYLLAEDSIDEDITDLINEKRIVVDAATEGEISAMPEIHILNDLIERLMK